MQSCPFKVKSLGGRYTHTDTHVLTPTHTHKYHMDKVVISRNLVLESTVKIFCYPWYVATMQD